MQWTHYWIDSSVFISYFVYGCVVLISVSIIIIIMLPLFLDPVLHVIFVFVISIILLVCVQFVFSRCSNVNLF